MLKHVKQILMASFIIGALFAGATAFAGPLYKIDPELQSEINQNRAKLVQNPSAETHFELAMSYTYTGQVEDGWDLLQKIPNYDKDYSSKVIKKYEALSKSNPKEWKYPFKLAFGYYFSERKREALAQFERALRLDPGNPWIMGFIALAKGDLGQLDEAIELCKQAIKIQPNGTALHFLLAQGFQRKGDYAGFLGETLTVLRLRSEEAQYNTKNSKNPHRFDN